MSDDQNIGIGSLNKMKTKMVVSEEKQKRAEEIAEEINEREGSESRGRSVRRVARRGARAVGTARDVTTIPYLTYSPYKGKRT